MKQSALKVYLKSQLCGLNHIENLEENSSWIFREERTYTEYFILTQSPYESTITANADVEFPYVSGIEDDNYTWSSPTAEPVTEHDPLSSAIQFLYQKVVIAICVLGVVGNLLNLVVLTQRSLLRSLGRMEKFVFTGLTSLALSDMLYCLTVIPHGFLPPIQITTRKTLAQYYHAYSNGLINTFMMTSTWVTVTMAVGRYFVAYSPFRARQIIGMTFAVRLMLAVFVVCLLFNLPRFWFYVIDDITCPDGTQYAFVFEGDIKASTFSYTTYMWMYFCVCILVPFLLLTYSNVGLIRALRHVTTRRENQTGALAHSRHQESGMNTVLTLIVVVLLFIFMVSPAEMITFLREMTVFSSSSSYDLAVACVNTLQATNFAFNFVLYCAINAHFHRTIDDLLHCRNPKVNACRRASSSHTGTSAV